MNARKPIEQKIFARAQSEWKSLAREPDVTCADILGFSKRFSRYAQDTFKSEGIKKQSGKKNLVKIYSGAVYLDSHRQNIAIRLARKLQAAIYAKYYMPIPAKEAIISTYDNTAHPEAYAQLAAIIVYRIKTRRTWKEMLHACATIGYVAHYAPDMIGRALNELNKAYFDQEPDSVLNASLEIRREARAFFNGQASA